MKNPTRAVVGIALCAVLVTACLARSTEPSPVDDSTQAPPGADAEPAMIRSHVAVPTPGRSGPIAAAPTPSTPPAGAPYLDTEVLVRVGDGSVEQIAASHGSRVLSTSSASGYAALAVPEGLDRASFLQALQSDPAVASAASMGVMQGTGETDDIEFRASPSQWHLVATRAPLPEHADVSPWIVAVLDTGVAYEHHTDSSHTYVPAPSLEEVPITAPWDFVGGDAHANDDHQHGTHIASLIASSGAVRAWPPAPPSCRSRCSTRTTEARSWHWWTASTGRWTTAPT